MSFSKARLIRFNDIVPECQPPAALKLPKDKVTVTVKSKKPAPSPKTEYDLTKSVPVTFKTPTLPKKVKTATTAMKIKPKDLFNNDSETLGFKSQECENNTKYIHNLTEQLDALKKELSDLKLEKEHLQRQQQKEIQEQLQRQEEEANIRIKNLEQRMSSEISTLNETHEYHIGQLILDCEIKLKDVKEASESILKQRLEEMEEHLRKKLQEKEKESEEILKECQVISYGQSPSSNNPYNTPSSGYSPNNPYNPQTPGASLDVLSYWHTVDIEVRIWDSHDDAGLVGQTGIIRSISGAMCSVFLPEEDRVVNIIADHLDPVRPQRGDHFKVIIGEEREQIGELLSIDSHEGVVKIKEEVTMLPLQNLCKIRKMD